MYELKHFRAAFYILVFVGMCGFSLATQTPGLWVLSVLALGLNAWLVSSGRFKPFSRPVASILSIAALVASIFQIQVGGSPRVILICIGQFLDLTLLVKLYEQRSNRDYAQVIILSTLLMIAAAVMSTDLPFGLLFTGYLVLAFYCGLLFHLKTEADKARKNFVIPEEKLSPLTLRQDQRFLLRSMRRLTALVFVVASICGVIVFVSIPRGPAGGVFGQLQIKNTTGSTGFSDKVTFEQIRQIQQSDEPVGTLKVWHNGRLIEGTGNFYLRGVAMDVYGIDTSKPIPAPQWYRPTSSRVEEASYDSPTPDETSVENCWKQEIVLNPTGGRYLFALPGLMIRPGEYAPAIVTSRKMNFRFQAWDGAMMTEPIGQQLNYTVWSVGSPFRIFGSRDEPRAAPASNAGVLAKVRKYAIENKLIPDSDEKIPPADREEIAKNIEQHLKSKFTYSLDLTSHKAQFAKDDPIVVFLNDVKMGHCEYFASAMTLICQSAGIPARMVVGYHVQADTFNSIGDFYTIRQSQAHSWVEVMTPNGWTTFDPTSSREAPKDSSLLQTLAMFYDYLQYQWAVHVVAFDASDRENLSDWLDTTFTQYAIKLSSVTRWLANLRNKKWLDQSGFWELAFRVFLFLIIFGVSAIFALLAWFLHRKHRLRQRAARIGLGRLPDKVQIRLAAQLAFYDDLTRLLESHQLVRARHLTPMQFAHSLVTLPAEPLDRIIRMTQLLYKVRFGNAALSTPRQKRLRDEVRKIGALLGNH